MRQRLTLNVSLRRRLGIAVFVLVAFVVAPIVMAGSITNPGGAPFSKLSVYQGVLSIVPGGTGDSVMEIGNAGRDIASTGSIYLRPAGEVVIAAPSGSVEGGQLSLRGAGSNKTWITDVYANQFRIMNEGDVRLVIDGPAGGNIYIPTGKLCFGNVGDTTKCANSWATGGPGGSQDLDSVLQVGSWTDSLAQFQALNTTPTYNGLAGEVLINRTGADGYLNTPLIDATVAVDDARAAGMGAVDAIAGRTGLSNNSGIYGENLGLGYAGFFSSHTNVTNTPSSTYPASLGAENNYGGRAANFYSKNVSSGSPDQTLTETVRIQNFSPHAPGVNDAQSVNALFVLGDAEIVGAGASGVPSPNAGDVLKVSGNGIDGGYAFRAYNSGPNGGAARFDGNVVIQGYTQLIGRVTKGNNTNINTGFDVVATVPSSGSSCDIMCGSSSAGLTCVLGINSSPLGLQACGLATTGTCLCK